MLAGIAERVLGSVLGKYVEGLDKKNINVGIWSGDFVIENVSVKPEVMDIANLPMNLLFSHIGRIRALIPWKDLSGSPVEIEMDDLYIIAAPKTLEDIEKIGVDLFNDRHSMINEFAKTMEENIKKSAKDKAKEDGYISKLTTKIIDNVQVRIKNIHIRFECKVMDKPMFSFGMTLDGLTIYTTDEAGTKIYVDRTNKKNEGKPMHKRLHLVDFSVYWNFENQSPMFKGDRLACRQEMANTIFSKANAKNGFTKDFDYMLKISVELKLLQHTKNQKLIDSKTPEIQVFLDLEKFEGSMAKDQFGQLMSLLDYFSGYINKAAEEKTLLMTKYSRPVEGITGEQQNIYPKDKEECKDIFNTLYQKQAEKENGLVLLSTLELEQYKYVSLTTEETILKEWITDIVKEKAKKKKEESKVGFFSSMFSSSKSKASKMQLTEEEEREIEKLIKDSLDDEDAKKNLIVPDDYNKLVVNFNMKLANFYLKRNLKEKRSEEKIEMKIADFQTNFGMRKNGMDIDIKLVDFSIAMKTTYMNIAGKKNEVTTNIFKPIVKSEDNKLLSLIFENKPTHSPGLDNNLVLRIASSEIVYHGAAIDCIVNVFENQNAQLEAYAKAAADQVEEASKQAQEQLNAIMENQTTLKIDIEITAPTIILAFNQFESLTSECWVLKPGILKVFGGNYAGSTKEGAEPLQFDNFIVILDKIKIAYMPSVLEYKQIEDPEDVKINFMAQNMLKNIEELREEKKLSKFPYFEVLKDFTIKVDLKILKPHIALVQKDRPKFAVEAHISKLCVDLRDKIYVDLMKFGDIFAPNEWGELLQTEKKGLLSANQKFGYVDKAKKTSAQNSVFNPIFCILAGGRIYFFEDNKQQAACNYFNLEKITTKSSQISSHSKQFGLIIKNKKGQEVTFAFESDAVRKEWKEQIDKENLRFQNDLLNNIIGVKDAPAQVKTQTSTSDQKTNAVQESEKSKDLQKTKEYINNYVAHVDLQMEQLGLRVFDDEKQMFDFSIQTFKLVVDHYDLNTKVFVSLSKIIVDDVQQTDPHLRNLITSEIDKSVATQIKGLEISGKATEDQQLMKVNVLLTNPEHKDYKHTDLEIDISFRQLFINVKPDPIHRLMVFFIPKVTVDNEAAQVVQTNAQIGSQTGDKTKEQHKDGTPEQKQLIDHTQDKTIQMKLKFTLQRITIIMINEIKNVYLSHASISDVKIDFSQFSSYRHIKGHLGNMQLHDLTNYPDTITTTDLDSIKATELFGLCQHSSNSSHKKLNIIELDVKQLNPEIAIIPESLAADSVSIVINQIKISLFLQVILRIVDFLTGQLLPALNTDEDPVNPETNAVGERTRGNMLDVSTVGPSEPKPQVSQQKSAEQMADALKKPYWMKLNVKIFSPIISVSCRPDSKESMEISLGTITVKNKRVQSKNRVSTAYESKSSQLKKLGLSTKVDSIWVELFNLEMQDLSIKEIHLLDNRSTVYQYIMHRFNFNLGLEMSQYEEEYKYLYKAINYENCDQPALNTSDYLGYDGGMLVNARLSPIIMVFGNHEFNFIMKHLFHNITYDDQKNKFFSEEKIEDVGLLIEESDKITAAETKAKGPTMQVHFDIDRIALVAMDDVQIAPQDQTEGQNIKSSRQSLAQSRWSIQERKSMMVESKNDDNGHGGKFLEERQTYAILFLEGLRLDMKMHTSGDMDVHLGLQNIRGSYLEKTKQNSGSQLLDLYEKGFIGRLDIVESYKAKDCTDLRRLVVQKLKGSSYVTQGAREKVSYQNPDFTWERLSLEVKVSMKSTGYKNIDVRLERLKILAQTNVLMKLSGISEMAPDVKPADMVELEKLRELQEQERQKELKRKKKELQNLKSTLQKTKDDNSLKLKEKKPNMDVNLLIKRVMFVIPTKEHKDTLVTSGDIALKLQMFDTHSEKYLWEVQSKLSKSGQMEIDLKQLNLMMHVEVVLSEFQIFLCQFKDLLEQVWSKVSKRHLLLPLNAQIKFQEYKPVWVQNQIYDFYSYKKIDHISETEKYDIDGIAFKVALSDIDLLNQIMAYQMSLLGDSSAEDEQKKKKEDPKSTDKAIEREPKQDSTIETRLTKAGEDTQSSTLAQTGVVTDQVADLKPRDSLDINKFTIQSFQVILINDANKIFVPVLDFTINNMSLDIFDSVTRFDQSITLQFDFVVNYFNPGVSRWEPFMEKIGMEITVNVNEPPKPQPAITTIKLSLKDTDQSGELPIWNVNLSSKGVGVVFRTLDTLEKWNEKRLIDSKAIKDAEVDYLYHLKDIKDKEEIEPGRVALENTLQKGSAQIEGDPAILDTNAQENYVSPYILKNMTGYDIKAEEYIRKTTFDDMPTAQEIHENYESLQRENSITTQFNANLKGELDRGRTGTGTGTKSKMTRQRLGTTYLLKTNQILNMKLEENVEMKKGKDKNIEIVQKNQRSRLIVTLNHNEMKLNPIYGISMDTQYSKRVKITGARRYIEDYSLICDCIFDEEKKTLTLSSPALIKNLTGSEIIMDIAHIKNPVQIALKEGDIKPVPFDYLTCKFSLSCIEDGEVKMCEESYHLSKLTNKEDGFVREFKFGENKYVIARIERDPQIFQRITIVFLPVIQAQNCLPVDLHYAFTAGPDTVEGILLPQESVKIYSIDPVKDVSVSIRVPGFRKSGKTTVVKGMKLVETVENLEILDKDGVSSKISVGQITDSKNVFSFLFYAPAVIINETALRIKPWYVNEKGKKPVAVAGLNPIDNEAFNHNIMFLDKPTERFIKLRVDPQYLEQEYPGYTNDPADYNFPVQNLDSRTYLLTLKKTDSPDRLFELGLNFKSLFVHKEVNIYTKVIQISPSNVFVNTLEQSISLRQHKCTEILCTVEPGARVPYFWTDKNLEKKLEILIGDDNTSRWSNKIDTYSLGTVSCQIISADGMSSGDYKYEIKKESGISYCFFKMVQPEEPIFILKNESDYIKINAFQKGFENQFVYQLGRNQETIMSWTAPDSKRTLSIVAEYDGKKATLDLDLVKINKIQELEIGAGSGVFVQIKVELRKTAKLIRVIDMHHGKTVSKDNIAKDVEVVKNGIYVELKVQKMGISLIGQNQETRLEPLYVLFEGLEVVYQKSEAITYIEMRLQYMNIDNNCMKITPFPVLLTPSKSQKASEQKHLIRLTLKLSNDSTADMQLYESVRFEIDSITLGIDNLQLEVMIEVISNILKIMEKSVSFSYLHKYFYLISKSMQDNFTLTEETLYTYPFQPSEEYHLITPPTSKYFVYMEELAISPIELVISFRKRPEESKKKLLGVGIVLNTLGIAFLNLDEAQLSIKGILMEHVFESTESLQNILNDHYVNNALKQLYKVIGSLELFGNPVNLLGNIGTGVVKFFDEPIKGFVKGPLDGVKGIGRGAGSLVKHTVKGTFNSVSKITGTVATGISSLSMDEQYMRERERINMNKPKGVLQGVGGGAKSLSKGIWNGVTGVFVMPVRGAKEEGVKGFFKGTVKGIAGLVTKPVAGVLDLASQTTAGIKAETIRQEDRANEEKERLPRVFYGKEKFFRAYNKNDSTILRDLQEFEDAKYSKDNFMQSFDFKPEKPTEPHKFGRVLVTFEHIMYLKVDSKNRLKTKILFSIEPKFISSISRDNAGLTLEVKDVYANAAEYRISCTSMLTVDQISEIVDEVRYAHLATQTLDNLLS